MRRFSVAVYLSVTLLLGAVAMPSASAVDERGVTQRSAGDEKGSAQGGPSPKGGKTAKTLLGGASKDWAWYQANIGPVKIYRYYDKGFTYATYQDNTAHAARTGDAVSDYSFKLPPAEVAAGVHDEKLRTFIASTPKTIILTNYHEPEDDIEAGAFSAEQFRAAIARLDQLVNDQNKRDRGSRRVSVVLMRGTFTGLKGRDPANYWPKDPSTGANQADLLSVDAFAVPSGTNTTAVPQGYTDGAKWIDPATLLGPSLKFAKANGTQWGVSEFGYLEDVNNPTRKAQAITDGVAYARANGAVMFEYFDSGGPAADWQLRYHNPPVPSTSDTSNAVLAWKQGLASG